METALPDTLIVRRLPECLTEADLNELFHFFGANTVKKEKPKGRQRNGIAIVKFDSHDDASYALNRLHQLLVLGKRIVVEYADFTILPCNLQYSSQTNVHMASNVEGKTFNFPPANLDNVDRIAELLLANEEFYHKVLQLMRSLNLPPPFGEPAELVVVPSTDIEEVEMEELFKEDTEESELETDDTEVGVQKEIIPHILSKPKKLKLKRSTQSKMTLNSATSASIRKKTLAQNVDEVFEKDTSATKTLTLKIPSDVPRPPPSDVIEQVSSDPPETVGFGTFTPLSHTGELDQQVASNDAANDDPSEFITKQKLQINKLQEEEMNILPVFRNYSPGNPSSRLYVKNLSKTVKENDLKYIFGRYVLWTSEEERNMFDIRLMTEGRMKGQAFITLPNLDRAREALNDTNGFMLQGKPLVVNFARSASTKMDTNNS